MHATPCGIFMDLHFMSRRKFLKELPVVGDLRKLPRFDVLEGVGQGHLTMSMVVTVGFSISCDMGELRPGT